MRKIKGVILLLVEMFALAFFIDEISLVGALHSWFGLSNTIVIKHSKKEYLEILKTLHRMWCLG